MYNTYSPYRASGRARTAGSRAAASAFSDDEALDLAAELLGVASEAELDQFLGSLIKKAGKGLGKIAKFAAPLASVLRPIAKAALPMVGTALGSFIPVPGLGSMIGGTVGSMVAKALEMEVAGAEDRELEAATRFVQLAGAATQQAAQAPPGADPRSVARGAVLAAARDQLPHFNTIAAAQPPAVAGGAHPESGRWMRRGRTIIVYGV